MKTILLISAFFFIMQGCAQKGYGVLKSEAYYKVSLPGALQVDDNGNPVNNRDTTRIIYLETSGNSKPEVSRIIFNGKPFTSLIEAVQQTPKIAGTKMNNEKVMLQPAKGNSLWKVQLIPDLSTAVQQKPAAGITVQGSINHKPFTLHINTITELQPDLHY